jgi:hypothetical protein
MRRARREFESPLGHHRFCEPMTVSRTGVVALAEPSLRPSGTHRPSSRHPGGADGEADEAEHRATVTSRAGGRSKAADGGRTR